MSRLLLFSFLLFNFSFENEKICESALAENRVNRKHAIQRVKIKFHDYIYIFGKIPKFVRMKIRENYDKGRKKKSWKDKFLIDACFVRVRIRAIPGNII